MRIAFATLLALHGLTHLPGFANGAGLTRLSLLAVPISRPLAALWLGAAALLLVSVAVGFVRRV